ncbi:hypothetical protein EVAR_74826_1 [Eumeta japonica]|uniref:Uncharacterized protein n=1 Tax=Eumeta variegata TaxID=151549 RepID=A0A4C1SQ18_EUMVA|nr:hypothetical protein EVAR_74826_1 [Eumeta japonica]
MALRCIILTPIDAHENRDLQRNRRGYVRTLLSSVRLRAALHRSRPRTLAPRAAPSPPAPLLDLLAVTPTRVTSAVPQFSR